MAPQGLLISQALALNNLAALGFSGPTAGFTPLNAATNALYGAIVNNLAGQLAGILSAQTLLGLGTGAMLANSGRRFLVSTYFGL